MKNPELINFLQDKLEETAHSLNYWNEVKRGETVGNAASPEKVQKELIKYANEYGYYLEIIAHLKQK